MIKLKNFNKIIITILILCFVSKSSYSAEPKEEFEAFPTFVTLNLEKYIDTYFSKLDYDNADKFFGMLLSENEYERYVRLELAYNELNATSILLESRIIELKEEKHEIVSLLDKTLSKIEKVQHETTFWEDIKEPVLLITGIIIGASIVAVIK
jgi:hypothetical protein